MVNLKGRTVAITGAASGLGLGMAKRCHKLGAKLALADIEAPALAALEEELKAMGADFFTMVMDVSKLRTCRHLPTKPLLLTGVRFSSIMPAWKYQAVSGSCQSRTGNGYTG